jgi:hypothetical protein
MASITVNFEDKEYIFDLDDIGLREASIIYDKYGYTLSTLPVAFSNGEPAAVRVFYWLMMNQNGEKQNIERVDFKIIKFRDSMERAMLEESRAEIQAKVDELEAKREFGETLTPEELDFLTAVGRAGLAPLPKAEEGTSSPA